MPNSSPTATKIHTTPATSRERFLTAARSLFASRGYGATTTREIVAAAGSSMGNLYFYFPDKEGVLRAVLAEAMDGAARTVDAAIAQATPGPAQLAAAVMAGVESLLAEADLARIVFVEAPRSGLRAEVIAPFANRVQRFFEAYPDLLHGPPPDVAAGAWVGAIWQAVEGQLNAHPPRAPRDLGRDLARWNLNAIGLPPATVARALDDAAEALAALAALATNERDEHAAGELREGDDTCAHT